MSSKIKKIKMTIISKLKFAYLRNHIITIEVILYVLSTFLFLHFFMNNLVKPFVEIDT